MEYFISALKKFTVLSGRSSRKEYWMFTLFVFIFSVALGFVDLIIMNVLETSAFLSSLFSLVVFIPSLAISIRRLHDINKSGKSFFINFIPLIGPIWFLILMIKAGDEGENEYGPVPVDGAADSQSGAETSNTVESLINPNQQAQQVAPAMQTPEQPVQTPMQPVQPPVNAPVNPVATQEAMPQQPVMNQQQPIEQSQVQPPVVPSANPEQPMQEITRPPQEG